MKNFSQYETSEAISKNVFVKFGKIFFIFACIFPIAQIMFYILMSSQPVHDIHINIHLYSFFSLIAEIPFIILLFLLVRNANKIKSYFHLNNIKLFYIGLIIYLIRYTAVILFTLSFLIYNILIMYFYSIVFTFLNIPVIGLVVEVITWNSLKSFFRNLKDFASTKTGQNNNKDWRNEYISAKILTIAAIMQIFYFFINFSLSPNLMMSIYAKPANLLIMIFYYTLIILFTVGYFMLSVTLMKEKISIKGDYNNNNIRNRILIENNNFSAPQKKFCGYCGHPIEQFMDFCPKCGNQLSS